MGASSSSAKDNALKSIANKDLFPAPSSNLNLKLRLEPVQSVVSNQGLPVAQRTAVLLTFLHPPKPATSQAIDDSSLYRIVIVTSQGIEEFCLITGNRGVRSYSESAGQKINAAVQFEAAELGKGVLLVTSAGVFKFVDLVTLEVKATFAGQREEAKMRMEKDEVTALTSLSGSQLAVGCRSGIVRAWEFGASEARVTFNSSHKWEMPGVSRIAYSHRIRSVLSGHENAFTNPQGRFFKLDTYEIRVYSVDFPAETEPTQEKSSELPGFAGSCFELAVCDAQNMAIALSSLENKVFIWSLSTQKLIFAFSLPKLTETAAIADTFSCVVQPDNKQVLTFGMSDGTAIVSQLALSEDFRLSWTPTKLIKPKSGFTGKTKDQMQITFVDHDSMIDMLVIGDRHSQVRLINNFLHEITPKATPSQPVAADSKEEEKEVKRKASEERINRIRKRVEGKEPKKSEEDSSGFQRFLNQRKEVLQQASPDKPYTDILSEIREEWKQMTPEDKQVYEVPLAEVNTPV